MKKILHINCNYMGTKLHQTMIEHLDCYEFINNVFCPIYSGSEIVTKPHDNVKVSKCFTLFDRFFFFRKQSKIINALNQSFRISDFSCLHAYTLFTDGNVAYKLSRENNIPYVVAVRATDLLFFRYRPYLRSRGVEILKNASAVFFLSETTRSTVFRNYLTKKDVAFLQKKTYIIPNGIDDYWLNNKHQKKDKQLNPQGQIKVLCVSKIIKRKNIPTLQKAIQSLNKKGWNFRLILIGEGTDKHELKVIIKDEFTTYIPPMEKEKLIDYYRKSDLFVLPSKGETFGLVYAEAMTQGLPVIYSEGEGFDGQFNEGVVGFRVNPNSEKDIADKMVRIVRNYSRICKMVLQCSENYKWQDIVHKYLVIYRKICNSEEISKSKCKEMIDI